MGKRCWTVESMAKIISNLGVISHPVSNLVSNPIRSGYILIIWMILSVSVYSINQTGISETKVSRRREFLTFRFLAKWVIFTLKLYEIPTEMRGRFWVLPVEIWELNTDFDVDVWISEDSITGECLTLIQFTLASDHKRRNVWHSFNLHLNPITSGGMSDTHSIYIYIQQ